MRSGLQKPGQHEDAQVDEFMDRAQNFAETLEGDLIGPFDHPAGVPADEPFEVHHDLGEIPGSMAVEDPGFTGSGVYAKREDREKWTEGAITVRSSDTSNGNITVRVRRKIDA